MENGSAFMIVLSPRERANREQDLDGASGQELTVRAGYLCRCRLFQIELD